MSTGTLARAGLAAAALAAAACGTNGHDGAPARGADTAAAAARLADAAPAAPRIQGEPLALPSGRRVVVLASGPVRFTQGPPALMVRYATELSVADTVPLAREAAEVFDAYRARAESARLTGLVASAFEMPKVGSGPQAEGYNFSWSRGADGTWHRN